ncbi:MAG: gliding motility-associated ABC transporter ATP-binding subunit GldA [Bacteroidales bacterium]|jgi:ABC-2 type transport system ATP-binding protein|nr:gliding motility-associated ABC transporter ATP-binding subunit GldA [Bacteroidales bacterium]
MSIAIQNLTKYYGEQKAVNNISFDVKSGEIVGFIGPNGAGKSTTMKIITGYISQFEGTVQVDGLDVRSQALEVKKNIGYLPEHNPLYVEMYVREYLEFMARSYGLVKPFKPAIDAVIEQTGLQAEQHKKIGALSKGYRQRVGLAAVLIHNPKVLILDEPTTGLDPNQILEIRNLIAEVGREKTILLSTHIMQEVEAICNRVIIINKGHIVANDKAELIKQQANEQHTTLLVEFLENTTREVLQAIDEVENAMCVSENQWLIKPQNNADIRKNVFDFAVKNSLTVISMQLQEKTLEEAFQQLTMNK